MGFDDSFSKKIKKYGLLGYCHKDPKKPQAVANTLDSIIKCRDCKHFGGKILK